MTPLRIGSLFSGIGGLELGLEMSGLGRTLWQVERDPFCRSILAKHWPDVERFEDVKEVGANLPPADLICGGFPCQDISSAGKGAGLAGSRSGLWFEFQRILSEVCPRWVVVENVASGAKLWVDDVMHELEQLGYEALPVPLSAESVGAPHLRRRIFIVAHSNSDPVQLQPGRRSGEGRQEASEPGLHGESRDAPDPYQVRRHGRPGSREVDAGESKPSDSGWGAPVSPICGVDDGVPDRVDRLRALGNAVVPQCGEVIGHMIRELITSTSSSDHQSTNQKG